MSVLQEQVLEAVRILSENVVTNSNATLTIECEIVDVIDAGLGQYTVKYGGNQFDVYNGNNSVIYKPNDIVYVLVPDGDFTKTKMILGAVTPSASMYIDSETVNKYIPISGNLFTNIDNIELCTYHSEAKSVSLDTTSFNMIFNDYLEDYKNFVLTAKVKTNMPIEQQQGGNYGITLTLPFLKDAGDGTGLTQKDVVVSMDVNTMQGNPYRFDEYALQNIYLQIAEGAVYDTSRNPTMTVFVQDFAQDESITAADIWIKDIAFQVVEELTIEDQEGYSLTLVASDGNYFLNSKNWESKTLTPILKINGKDKKYNDYECYWYVEDSSIKTDSEGYHKLGGLGWKCLNKKTNVQYNEEGKMTYQYVTNVYKLTVTSSDVRGALRYKCVLTKDDIVVGGQLTLKNLNYNILVNLVSATGSSTFVKDTGYVDLIARIYYEGETDNPSSEFTFSTAWQRFDSKGNFIDDNFISQYVRINDPVSIVDISGTVRKYLETEIKFPCSLVENSNLINCTFYGTKVVDGDTVKNNLGTASLIVNTSENFAYKVMIENGDVLFKYDADGDSPLVADYDGPVSSKIKEILPLNYKLFKADGSELTEDEYKYCNVEWRVPKNSMIKLKSSVSKQDDDYYYVTGKGQVSVNYTILDTYNTKKVDNSIILVIDFGGNVITEIANIKFLKDGESGTNGSKYAGVITYDGLGYGELNSAGKPHKLHPVLVVNAWKLCNSITGNVDTWTNPTMEVKVYKDGAPISSGYSVVWSIFDSSVTNPLFNINSSSGVITAKGTTWPSDDATSNIVEAKITVGNAGSTHAQEVIYAYYPIEITYLSNADYASGLIPNMDGGFSKVLYAADGTNPKYDNSNPFMYGGNLQEVDGAEYFSYSWSVSASGNLIRPSNYTSSSCAIKPVTKFDNGKSLNYVNVSMQLTGTGKTKAQNFVNQLTDQRTSISNEISYNQTTLQHILDFSEKFYYNNYVELIEKSQKLLLNRSNLIYYINQLFPILNNLKSYCSSKSIAAIDFDYNTVYNNRTNVLTAERTKLYKLGAYETLDSLDRLSSAKISLSDPVSFKNKYGLAVFDTVNNYINSFNDIIEKKYWVSYDTLCAKSGGTYVLIDQFNKFKQFEDNLIALCSDSDLTWLQSAHYGFGPEQEFINLKNQLTAYSQKLTDGRSYTADSVKKDVLNNYYSLIVKYQNDYYQRSYNNKIAVLREDLVDVDVKLADYKKIVLSQTSGFIKHSKPIVMILNRYELSNINGWDGNKLYIDTTNNEYILAPQMGAGTKINGLFTGVIMGVKQFNSGGSQKIGLFGYSGGIQSFFLNSEDGSAIFGKTGGGQIIIQPGVNTAIIKSGNYSTSDKTGMQIDLTTPEIRFGSGNFVVNSSGHITAKGGGSIAGWVITDTQLYSNVTAANGRLTLDSSANNGKIYSHSHNTLGSTAIGFYLSHDGLSISDGGSNNRIELNTSGNPKIYSGGHNSVSSTTRGFYLSQEGFSICNGTQSRIALSTTDDPVIYSGNHNNIDSNVTGFYLGQAGLSICNGSTSKIALKTNGNPEIYSNGHSDLTKTGNGFYLGNTGLSIGSKVYIDNTGTMRLGVGAVGGASTSKFWTISPGGGTETSETYIGYNTNGQSYVSTNTSTGAVTIDQNAPLQSVYLGTKAIRLGRKFAVDNYGNMIATNIHAEGYISATSGKIGDFNITAIAGTNPTRYKLVIGDNSLIDRDTVACGSAGSGIVALVGNRTDGWDSGNGHGYIQLANTGSPTKCNDGIRIYGNGHVVKYYGGAENVQEWDRWLSNIPTSTINLDNYVEKGTEAGGTCEVNINGVKYYGGVKVFL